jgi:hypothetical protein
MATSFACPSCKKVLKSNTPLPLGKIIKCPACQNSFAVSANGQADGPVPVFAGAAPTQSAAEPVKKDTALGGSGGLFDMIRPPAPESAPPASPAPVFAPPVAAAPVAALPTQSATQTMPSVDSLPELEELEEFDDKPGKKGRDDDDDDDYRRKNKKDRDRDDDEENDDRPRKKRKGRDDDDEEDDDDRSRKKKKGRDDDDADDDRPRSKKKGRDDEEDDDDSPRKKKKGRDEDDMDDDDDSPRKKKGGDDDEEVDDDRPRKKKKGRDDDDEDDFRSNKKGKGKKGKKSAGGSKNMLILAGGGGVGLILLVLLVWFVVLPMFSGGGGALAYMPADSEVIYGGNLSVFESASYKKAVLLLFPQRDEEVFVDLDTFMEGHDQNTHIKFVQSKKALDLEKFRKNERIFGNQLDAAESLDGRTVYRNRHEIQSVYSKTLTLFSPGSRTYVVGRVSEVDLKRMLNGTSPQLGRDMQTQVRKVQGSGLWYIKSLETMEGKKEKSEWCSVLQFIKWADSKEDLAKNKEEMDKESPAFVDAFRPVRCVTVTANPSESKLKIEGRIEFANDAEAKKVEGILNKDKEILKKMAVEGVKAFGLPETLPKNFKFDAKKDEKDDGRIYKEKLGMDMVTDVEKSLKVEAVGPALVVSAFLTDETFKKLAERVEAREKAEKERKKLEF